MKSFLEEFDGQSFLLHSEDGHGTAMGTGASFEAMSIVLPLRPDSVFVWRWQHVLDAGPYNLPDWLDKALTLEGNDPLRKLQTELEALKTWELQVERQTCAYIKNNEIEVLRVWGSEKDHQGNEVCQKGWARALRANWTR
eukprot:s2039_g18.t1